MIFSGRLQPRIYHMHKIAGENKKLFSNHGGNKNIKTEPASSC
jgi:hypothetical protein